MPATDKAKWWCSCGVMNLISQMHCRVCGASIADLSRIMWKDYLQGLYDKEHPEAVKEREAEEEARRKAEAEEMTARFLEFWQENDDWKAVSAKLVCEKLEEQSKDILKTKDEVFTLMVADAFLAEGSDFVEIGVDYLVKNKYIKFQQYGEGDDVEIFVAPTDKLLSAISSFVRRS